MKVGVLFHPHFAENDWPVIGNKFVNFPRILQQFSNLENVLLVEPEDPKEDLILLVHDKSYVESLKKAWYFRAACLSVSGTHMALSMIREGVIRSALVFSCAAGHHANRNSGWGGTYLSCIGPAIYSYWQRYGHERFAIIDTDSHHGDGTREIFKKEKDVLHVCFCSFDRIEGEGEKIDVDVGWRTTDEEYLYLVEKEFHSRVKSFKPYAIFHNFGHDTCEGDYGDRGLSRDFFLRLAKQVRDYSYEVCDGRYIIITHGGSRRDVAEYIFPEIIKILSQPDY
ncbi:MAG: hypothetical protein N2513_00635 [Deltaproteobacteria bacterium]|nr:hypothetical protein [Deltaproteobacteria bacterium]